MGAHHLPSTDHEHGHARPGPRPAVPAPASGVPLAPVPLPAHVLTVGHAEDAAEVEADRMADVALRRLASRTDLPPDPDDLERHGPGCTHLRRAAGPAGAEAVVGHEGGALDGATTAAIEARRGGGRPLDAPVLARMQQAFSSDLSRVRIHDDAGAAHLNRLVSARAFTTGDDIFFGSGEYAPSTPAGERVLAHELAHTLQTDTTSRRLPLVRRLGVGPNLAIGCLMTRDPQGLPEHFRITGKRTDPQGKVIGYTTRRVRTDATDTAPLRDEDVDSDDAGWAVKVDVMERPDKPDALKANDPQVNASGGHDALTFHHKMNNHALAERLAEAIAVLDLAPPASPLPIDPHATRSPEQVSRDEAMATIRWCEEFAQRKFSGAFITALENPSERMLDFYTELKSFRQAYIWAPWNGFDGPKPEDRMDDPKSALDAHYKSDGTKTPRSELAEKSFSFSADELRAKLDLLVEKGKSAYDPAEWGSTTATGTTKKFQKGDRALRMAVPELAVPWDLTVTVQVFFTQPLPLPVQTTLRTGHLAVPHTFARAAAPQASGEAWDLTMTLATGPQDAFEEGSYQVTVTPTGGDELTGVVDVRAPQNAEPSLATWQNTLDQPRRDRKRLARQAPTPVADDLDGGFDLFGADYA